MNAPVKGALRGCLSSGRSAVRCTSAAASTKPEICECAKRRGSPRLTLRCSHWSLPYDVELGRRGAQNKTLVVREWMAQATRTVDLSHATWHFGTQVGRQQQLCT